MSAYITMPNSQGSMTSLLQSQIVTMTETLILLENRITNYKDNFDNFQNIMNLFKNQDISEDATMQSNLVALGNQVVNLSSQLQQTTNLLNSTIASLNGLENGELETIQSALTTLQNTVSYLQTDLTSAINGLNTNIADVISNYTLADSQIQSQVTANLGTLTSLQTTVGNIQSNLTSAINGLNTNIADVISNYTLADSQLDTKITNNKNSVDASLVTVNNKINTNTNDISDLTTILNNLITSSNGEDASLAGQIVALSSTVTNNNNTLTNTINGVNDHLTIVENKLILDTATIIHDYELADTNLQTQINAIQSSKVSNTTFNASQATQDTRLAGLEDQLITLTDAYNYVDAVLSTAVHTNTFNTSQQVQDTRLSTIEENITQINGNISTVDNKFNNYTTTTNMNTLLDAKLNVSTFNTEKTGLMVSIDGKASTTSLNSAVTDITNLTNNLASTNTVVTNHTSQISNLQSLTTSQNNALAEVTNTYNVLNATLTNFMASDAVSDSSLQQMIINTNTTVANNLTNTNASLVTLSDAITALDADVDTKASISSVALKLDTDVYNAYVTANNSAITDINTIQQEHQDAIADLYQGQDNQDLQITDILNQLSGQLTLSTSINTALASKLNTSTYNADKTSIDALIAGKLDTSVYNANKTTTDANIALKANASDLTITNNNLASTNSIVATHTSQITALQNAGGGGNVTLNDDQIAILMRYLSPIVYEVVHIETWTYRLNSTPHQTKLTYLGGDIGDNYNCTIIRSGRTTKIIATIYLMNGYNLSSNPAYYGIMHNIPTVNVSPPLFADKTQPCTYRISNNNSTLGSVQNGFVEWFDDAGDPLTGFSFVIKDINMNGIDAGQINTAFRFQAYLNLTFHN